MTFAAALSLLALAAAPPDAPRVREVKEVEELGAAIARLQGLQPVRARVEHRFASSQGDDTPRPEGVLKCAATSGPDGLQVLWDRATIGEAEREEQRLVSDPNAPSPVRDALLDLRILTLAHVLDAGPELLRSLRGAELLEARDDVLDGAPARLLVLKVTPPLSARDRRYVKELDATARVWLGPDGLPRAVHQDIKAKGRAFLVISFDLELKERLRLDRLGDRLVALRRESEQRTSGAGDKTWRRSVTEVQPQP